MNHSKSFARVVASGTFAALLLQAASALAAPAAPNDPPDLGATPPDLSQSVDPNIIVTFDDSGSMVWTYMGDGRPYDGKGTVASSWAGPWACANVINPDIGKSSSAYDIASKPMNGVFYNPNITYTPPLYEDGSSFPNADATLKAVWQDGIAINRPTNKAIPGTAGYSNNPNGSSGANSGARTNVMGTYIKVNTTITDNRWKCGSVNTTTNWTSNGNQNPFDGTVADPVTGTTPNGGPVYWRFKSSALSSLTLDSITGQFTAAAQAALYTPGNWEAVSVPASQYQNFANWYAYYRYRNLMARTALSRVFGVIGTPTHANVRVLWQNINSSTYGGGSGSINGLNGKVITNLDDSTADPYGSAAKYRAAFFNWIFNTGASGSTPTRTAAIRAGNFLCNGLNANCNGSVSTSVNSTLNPYWSPLATSASGVQLACRQNFHMMMTDGLYNQPAISVTGNGSNASSTTAINLPAGFLSASDPSTYVGVASNTKSPTTIFGHSGWAKDSDTGSSYSDISFYYWVNNLYKQLTDANASATPKILDFVPAYFPDQTTGVTDIAATVDPKDPGATPELFWNPANDPATWPHLVQFAVTLGAFGNLTFSDDMDCSKDTNGLGVGKNDLCFLRTGQITSRGAVGWPQPNGVGSGIDANIDDLWHAALNSRGAFFVATNPSSLVQHLTAIIQSVAARTASSTSESVSTSILNQGTFGYTGGYDTGSWGGYLYKLELDATTAIATAADWDAGCILTGGTFTAIAPTSTAPPRGDCKVSTPPPSIAPATTLIPQRIIFTSVKSGSSLSGAPFRWSSLGSTEQALLNLDPTTTDVNQSTGQVLTTPSPTALAINDGNGTDRVDFLRGKRENETTPTSETLSRQFRIRKSLLGPIINSQVLYEAGPASGLQDIFPVGSAEQAAAAPCTGGLAASGCNSYEKFVKDNINRRPIIYTGANDGMLHAFDAATGSEVWAYVPNMLYGNGQLNQTTNPKNTLTTSVDDTPIISDVFLTTDSKWHTMLVGSMRLGGRGIFALDITDQSNPANEAAAAGKFMWEFTNANDPDLGYTYASTNIARLHNGKWVVLVTSGYFPQQLQVQSSTYGKNATPDNAPAASSGVTHMWVLDAATGAVIRKIDTPSAVTSYGLSTPNVVDFGLDQIGDVSVAGDLAGNLWRFNLSDSDPTKWSVEAMFKTYTSTAACSTSNQNGLGCEPITVQPEAFADPATGSVIYVFGSGQYLGPSDSTASSVLGINHFFGVRDYGTGSSKYPLHESDLVSQTLTQNGAGLRSLTSNTVPTTNAGWMIPLNVTPSGGSAIMGERNVVKAVPLFSSGIAVLTSLIPGANNDPCTPGRVGAVMAINAATGGPMNPPSTPGGSVVVGAEVVNPPATGGSAVISPVGGGSVIIPGVGIVGGGNNNSFTINGGLPIWRRTSWRELLNNL